MGVSSAAVEYRVLGPLEVLSDGTQLALGGAKQRALLALLLIHANEALSTDRLVEALWPKQPPPTAGHTIQVYVSNLRKVLGADRLLTRPPGYLLSVASEELDLARFERLLDEADRTLAAGEPQRAAPALEEALSLWRGPALADFTYEPFALGAIARLEELRLVAHEAQFEAELTLGRHSGLIAGLQAIVEQHPFRERMREQLMLALYRAGRQAEALEVFQQTRRLLVDELGIEPGPSLQDLERAILRHDPRIASPTPAAEPSPSAPQRSILVAAVDGEKLAQLLPLAERLARSPTRHDLILALALSPGGSLASATTTLNDLRGDLSARGVSVRAAAFTSAQSGADLVRLASEQRVDLLLLHGPTSVREGTFVEDAAGVLATAPCDVALHFGGELRDGPVLVPFAGGEHDWAALELGAWCATALGRGLRLFGAAGGVDAGERDASRLLAHAALAVQQLVGVVTEPVLAAPGTESLLETAEEACLVVVGLGEDWEERGLGATRLALLHRARPPTSIVRRGLRPGGLAPGETLTRFTWSLSGIASEAVSAGGEGP
jgi:DNA-binding SARP family transcriptional activator